MQTAKHKKKDSTGTNVQEESFFVVRQSQVQFLSFCHESLSILFRYARNLLSVRDPGSRFLALGGVQKHRCAFETVKESRRGLLLFTVSTRPVAFELSIIQTSYVLLSVDLV